MKLFAMTSVPAKNKVTRESLVSVRAVLREEGKRVGFTSGTFDLLHRGHVQYLKDAKALCDVLIVAVNSDASVKSYKDPLRPITSEDDRLAVITALEAVDYAFIFSETNNNQNIEVLKPDLYIKAGDYSKEQLSSAPLVESYGGAVHLVPMAPGYSTTLIIEKIAQSCCIAKLTGDPEAVHHEAGPAVFFDRDGTLIEHVEYLHEPEGVSFIPGAIEGLKDAHRRGYRLIMVTNQPGIGLGYYTKEQLFAVNRRILSELSQNKVFLDKIYFCPHSKSDGCTCRKPDTYFVARAKAELNIALERSVVVGDMTSDIEFGRRAGMKTVLVKTGRGGEDGLFTVSPDITLSSLKNIGEVLDEPPPRA